MFIISVIFNNKKLFALKLSRIFQKRLDFHKLIIITSAPININF